MTASLASWTHIRALSPSAAALIAEAAERSQIVTGLMEQVQRSTVVVYVTDPAPWFLTDPASYMALLSHVAGTRYLLVRIARRGLSSSDRIVLLGHELSHALEVAAAPEVTDGGGLARLYRRIGWSRGANRFESEAARVVAENIRRELARNPGP